MRRDLPSKFEPKIISESTTLTTHDLMVKGLIVAGASGITIALPTPQAALDGVECIVVNNSDGQVTLSCTNGFPNDADSLTLDASASLILYCAEVSAASYRWSCIGATAA